MSEAASDESPSSADTRRCPDCGYSLHGLDLNAKCPECGFFSDPQMLIVYGWGVGRYANSSNMRTKHLFLMTAFTFAWLIPFLNYRSVWGFGLVGLIVLPILWGLARRSQGTQSPAPVQIRFSSEGWSLRLGYGPVKTLSWPVATLFHVYFVGNGRYRIEISRPRVIGWPSLGTAFIEVEVEGDAQAAAIVRRTVNVWKNADVA